MTISPLSANPFLDMPDDPKNYIFSHLDLHSLMKLRATCQCLKTDVAQSLRERLVSIDYNDLDFSVNAERLGFLTHIFPCIRKVVFSRLNTLMPHDIVSFIKRTPSIEEIDLSAVNIDDTCLEALEGLTSLKKVAFSNKKEGKPKMETSMISQGALNQFLERAKNLQSISLEGFNIDGQVIEALSGKDIRELSLPSCVLSDLCAFAALLSTLTSLKIFRVSSIWQFNDSCLNALFRSVFLEEVDFSSCSHLSQKSIRNFIKEHSFLVSINFDNTNFDNEALGLIVHPENLKTISFSWAGVSSAHIRNFLFKGDFPALEELVMNNATFADQSEIINIVASHVPNITTIKGDFPQYELAQVCKKLKIYHQWNAFVDDKWMDTVCSLQGLEELSLSTLVPLTSIQFQRILESCKKLKTIKLTTNSFGEGCLRVLKEHGSQIRSLTIHGKDPLLDSGLDHLESVINSMKNLRFLDLDFDELPKEMKITCRYLYFFNISHERDDKKEYYAEAVGSLDFIGDDDFTVTLTDVSDMEE